MRPTVRAPLIVLCFLVVLCLLPFNCFAVNNDLLFTPQNNDLLGPLTPQPQRADVARLWRPKTWGTGDGPFGGGTRRSGNGLLARRGC